MWSSGTSVLVVSLRPAEEEKREEMGWEGYEEETGRRVNCF